MDKTPPRGAVEDSSAPDPSQPTDVGAIVGEPFTLPLPAGAATGAEWRLDLPAGLRSAGETDASTAALPGDSINSLPIVIAEIPGTFQVAARLLRPWDGSVLREVTVRVTVR